MVKKKAYKKPFSKREINEIELVNPQPPEFYWLHVQSLTIEEVLNRYPLTDEEKQKLKLYHGK